MVIAHTFLALLGGFATMALLVILLTVFLKKTAPEFVGQEAHPQPAYVAVNLGFSLLAGAAGGFVTAWAAVTNPLFTVLALAMGVLILGALSALQARGKQPAWYQVSLMAITPVGVLIGGLLRLKLAGAV